VKYSSKEKNTQLVKQKALELGFDFCGISKAEKLLEEEAHLKQWLSRGYQGKMSYLENHLEKRLDPTLLVPGAKSVISLLYNYYPEPTKESTSYKVARYAYGKDYHFVIKDKLKLFMTFLTQQIGEISGRVFVDSAPVMERQWAARSGLGWLGKNTLLINKQQGSYFFLAEMILGLELEEDGPIKDYCGSCTRCLDACPTDAFTHANVLDASKCISYFTIELQEEIPEEFKDTYESWVFGCDICQEVCPWNRFSKVHSERWFEKSEGIKNIEAGRWQEITDELFNEVFKYSPLKRAKYKGLQKNFTFINKKPC
jgi:epoxyqueuosine reductase